MSDLVQETFFDCPYCGERVSALLDLSAGDASYIEDCEVCCRPLAIRFSAEDGRLLEFRAERTD